MFAGLLALACAPARAGLTAGPGTSAAPFLDLGFGARGVALSDAFVSAADDVSAVYYNPGALALPASPAARDPKQAAKPWEMLVSESLLVQDVDMTQVGLVRRPYGFSLTRLNLGGIERRTTETAAPDGTIGASDLAVGFSAAHEWGGVGFGATAKYIHENIGSNDASAYAVDLGALKRFDDLPLSVGAELANLGTKIRFLDQQSPLPTAFRVGATYGLTPKFPHALTLQVDVPHDGGPVLRLSGEYAGFGPLALRFGWQTVSADQRAVALGKSLGTTASGISEFYGMTFGAGLRTPYGNIDYAIVPYGEIGTAQRFAYSYAFGGGKP